MKRKHYLSIGLFSVVALLSGCANNSMLYSPKEDNFKLSLLHVNDTHSHITSDRMKFKVDGKKIYFNVGGYPRMITKIEELKREKPNSLILNAGDTFQGTLYYTLFRGEADATALNLIKWDAYELGNHEFDDGDEGLKSLLDRLNKDIKIISANVEAQDGSLLANMWKPYIIKEIDGQKVGIIGIDVVRKTKESSSPSDKIKFLDELKTAQKYIDILQSKNINKIVLLTHQGYKKDIEMAKNLNGVDIIIGGDSHSLLGDFSALGLKSASNEYPTKVNSKNGKKVCIAQAWEHAHSLGNLDVEFNHNGDVVQCKGDSILLLGDTFLQKNKAGKKVKVDKELAKKITSIINNQTNMEIVKQNKNALEKIKKYTKSIEAKKAIAIGEASEDLGHNRIPGDKKDGQHMLPLGSDIAPIVAKSFYDLSKLADACIQNAGGVRIAINKGEITTGDAYSLLPFANTLYEIKMYGSEIKQVLEDAITNIKKGGSSGSFPYAYGLKYDIDMSKNLNHAISNLEIKDRKTGKWSTIDNNKLYTIVTNSYTAQGKDGYVTFKSVQDKRGLGVDTYLDYALSFVKYVETKKANGEKVSKLPQIDHPIKSFKK